MKCRKKWVTLDHESVNHPVGACRGRIRTEEVDRQADNLPLREVGCGKNIHATAYACHNLFVLTICCSIQRQEHVVGQPHIVNNRMGVDK